MYAGEVQVFEDWLEVDVGPGWIAAFRLVSRGRAGHRRTDIAELRVFPAERSANPGEWSGVRRGRSLRLPRTRFSFARVRAAITEQAFQDALSAVRENLAQQRALGLYDDPVAMRTPPPASPDRGRPGRPRAEYARLALRYDELEAERTGGESTRRRLARELGISEAATAKRLERARQFGFLDPVKPGQRGGHATPLAYRLAGQLTTASKRG